MDIWNNYTSPFGYQTGVGGIDTYGVNHNNFSLHDELEYQFARQKRENQLMQQYNNQGITENYPQYTTNFWGNSANNYGFGNSNISANIENMQNDPIPIPMATATPQQVSNDNYLNKTQRIDALKNGQILNLHIENNPEANYNRPYIELGVLLIKQLYNSLANPSPDRIGTSWNETGANQINDVGARVKTAFETKPWL